MGFKRSAKFKGDGGTPHAPARRGTSPTGRQAHRMDLITYLANEPRWAQNNLAALIASGGRHKG